MKYWKRILVFTGACVLALALTAIYLLKAHSDLLSTWEIQLRGPAREAAALFPQQEVRDRLGAGLSEPFRTALSGAMGREACADAIIHLSTVRGRRQLSDVLNFLLAAARIAKEADWCPFAALEVFPPDEVPDVTSRGLALLKSLQASNPALSGSIEVLSAAQRYVPRGLTGLLANSWQFVAMTAAERIRTHATPQAVEEIVALLEHAQGKEDLHLLVAKSRALALLTQLGKSSRPALPAIRALLKRTDVGRYLVSEATLALPAAGASADETIPLLLEDMDRAPKTDLPHEGVQWVRIREAAILSYGTSALPVLVDRLNKKCDGEVVSLVGKLGPKDETAAEGLFRVLVGRATSVGTAPPVLVVGSSASLCESEFAKSAAADALGAMGELGISRLKRILGEPHDKVTVRMTAAQLLKRGAEDPRLSSILESDLVDKNPALRIQAARQLVTLSPAKCAAVEKALGTLPLSAFSYFHYGEHPAWQIFEACGRAPASLLPPCARILASHRTAYEVELLCLRLVGLIGPPARAVAENLKERLSRSTEEVISKELALALLRITNFEHEGVVVRSLRTDAPSRVKGITQALASYGHASKNVMDSLVNLSDSPFDALFACPAARAIAAIGAREKLTEKAIDAVFRQMANPSCPFSSNADENEALTNGLEHQNLNAPQTRKLRQTRQYWRSLKERRAAAP